MEKIQQYQRHNQILERLNNGEILSIKQLSLEWKIHTKTLQRDFKKLMECNSNIIRAENGKAFKIQKYSNSSSDALTAIHILDSISNDIGGELYTTTQSILHKIQNYIDSPFYTRIDIEQISNKLDIIYALENAITQQKVISLKYRKRNAKNTIKTYQNVHPYKIVIFDGFWYLLAKYKEHYIKFYLKEIHNLKILDKNFIQDKKILDKMNQALNIWFSPEVEPFNVTLLLNYDAIVYFERKPIKGQFLKKNPDSTAELTVSITNKHEIFAILKKWLPQIKIIEPYELQIEFENMLQQYLNVGNN